MSTRCTTHFAYRGTTSSIIYRHCDGYPEGAGVDIYKFLDEVNGLADKRFDDASYLAAKYVVFLAREFADGNSPLDFLSVGVLLKDPKDIEYRYIIDCGEIQTNGYPLVSCYSIYEKKEVNIPGYEKFNS